jgi:hypothetical protein
MVGAAPTTATPNGMSPAVIGLASGGSLLGAILIVAAVMNIRHHQQKKKMRLVAKRTEMWAHPTHNLARVSVEQ